MQPSMQRATIYEECARMRHDNIAGALEGQLLADLRRSNTTALRQTSACRRELRCALLRCAFASLCFASLCFCFAVLCCDSRVAFEPVTTPPPFSIPKHSVQPSQAAALSVCCHSPFESVGQGLLRHLRTAIGFSVCFSSDAQGRRMEAARRGFRRTKARRAPRRAESRQGTCAGVRVSTVQWCIQ